MRKRVHSVAGLCLILFLSAPLAHGDALRRGWNDSFVDALSNGFGVVTWSNVFQIGCAIAERWEHTDYGQTRAYAHPYRVGSPPTPPDYSRGWIISTNEQVPSLQIVTGMMYDLQLICSQFVDARTNLGYGFDYEADLTPNTSSNYPPQYTLAQWTAYACATNAFRQVLNLETNALTSPLIFGEMISQLYTGVNLLVWMTGDFAWSGESITNSWTGWDSNQAGSGCDDCQDWSAMIPGCYANMIALTALKSGYAVGSGNNPREYADVIDSTPNDCSGFADCAAVHCDFGYAKGNMSDFVTNRPRQSLFGTNFTWVGGNCEFEFDLYGYGGVVASTHDCFYWDNHGHSDVVSNEYRLFYTFPSSNSAPQCLSTQTFFESGPVNAGMGASCGTDFDQTIDGYEFFEGFSIRDYTATNGYAFIDTGVLSATNSYF